MAVCGTDMENGETASVAGGTMIDAGCASAPGAATTVADAAAAANKNNWRRDGPCESELLNPLYIGLYIS